MTDWLEYRWLAFLATFALATSAISMAGADLRTSLLIGFDLAGALLLFALGVTMFRGGAAAVKENAQRIDAGRWAVLFMGIVLSTTALVGLGMEIQAAAHESLARIVLGAASIVVAWLLMNTLFALHYAHTYYVGDGGSRGGLEFPGTDLPDYFDFLYFALVLGMTFQVSDVVIVSSHIRRVALVHAIIAFFFNVIVLALSVSLLGSVI
ncbi:MAG: DUF1345 domain-containing protein [Pseudomonadales bacterium]